MLFRLMSRTVADAAWCLFWTRGKALVALATIGALSLVAPGSYNRLPAMVAAGALAVLDLAALLLGEDDDTDETDDRDDTPPRALFDRTDCPTGAAALDAYAAGDHERAHALFEQALHHGTPVERFLAQAADDIAQAAYLKKHQRA